uniref:Ig-like domain-containing protein n=1 Tax=Poecilia latipinna TaxID=48699 RepID=A0A3B3V588_9TELE
SVQKDEDLPWWLIGGLIAAAVAVIIIIGVTFHLLPAADPEVSCVFRHSCLLPCQFQSGSGSVIRWSNPSSAGDSVVHSYYDGQDQLGQQNQKFQGRTSLILDQISRGNASLLLKEVKIQDEGRYKCNISSSTGYKESFINLKIDVSDIRIHQDGNRITCSSEGIYPQPELTWSTEPPSNTALQNRTTVHQTEEKLYDISSSLTGPDGPDLIYSCSIRTRSNRRTETLKKGVSAAISASVSALICTLHLRKHFIPEDLLQHVCSNVQFSCWFSSPRVAAAQSGNMKIKLMRSLTFLVFMSFWKICEFW